MLMFQKTESDYPNTGTVETYRNKKEKIKNKNN